MTQLVIAYLVSALLVATVIGRAVRYAVESTNGNP